MCDKINSRGSPSHSIYRVTLIYKRYADARLGPFVRAVNPHLLRSQVDRKRGLHVVCPTKSNHIYLYFSQCGLRRL